MKVDQLIKGCQVVNVYRKRFESVDIAIIGNKFAYVEIYLQKLLQVK